MAQEEQTLLEDEGAGYLVSVSDLMSGLLFIFIILLVGFILTYTTHQNEPMVPESKLIQALQWKKTFELLSKEYIELKGKHDQLKGKLKETTDKYLRLQAKHHELKIDHETLQQENIKLKNLIGEYLKEIDALKNVRDELIGRVAGLQQQVRIQDQKILEFKEQIADLQKSLDIFGDISLEDLNKIIKDLEWVKEYLLEYLEEMHTSSKKNLFDSLSHAAEEEGLLVNIDEQTAIIRVPGIYFMEDTAVGWKSNYSFSSDSREVIRKLGVALLKVLPCFAGTVEAWSCDPKSYGSLKIVLIEGHVAPGEFRNPDRAMEVSMRHSFTVFHDLLNQKENKKLKLLKNRDGEPIFSTSGYGANRPISAQKKDYMRDLNRRVDLRFILAAPMIPVDIIDQIKRVGIPAQ